jgi:hypothetical protein
MASADVLAVCRAGGTVVPLLSLSPLDAGEEKPRSGKQEEGRKEGRRRSIEGAQK